MKIKIKPNNQVQTNQNNQNLTQQITSHPSPREPSTHPFYSNIPIHSHPRPFTHPSHGIQSSTHPPIQPFSQPFIHSNTHPSHGIHPSTHPPTPIHSSPFTHRNLYIPYSSNNLLHTAGTSVLHSRIYTSIPLNGF